MIRTIEKVKINEGITIFMEGLTSQSRAKSTITEYHRVLNRLDIFLSNGKVIYISDITHLIVDEFLEYCKKEYNLKYKTIYKYYAFLSNFFTEMYNLDYISSNPTNKLIMKRPQTKKDFFYLNYDEIETIIETAKNQKSKLRSLTDSCFIRILAETGLRRTDGLSITWNQVKLHKKELNVIIKKVNQEVNLPITQSLYDSLVELKRYTRPNPFDPVFLSNRFIQICTTTMNTYFKKHVKNSGVVEERINKINESDMPQSQKDDAINKVEITFHTMRHSFITRCFLEGKTAEEISNLTGNSDMDTLLSYKSMLKTDYRIIADTLDAL